MQKIVWFTYYGILNQIPEREPSLGIQVHARRRESAQGREGERERSTTVFPAEGSGFLHNMGWGY